MLLQQRSEPWLCMPLAFAAVMDMPVEELMAEIGHDGGKILFRNLTEPACRQGFHIQELVHVALQHGLAMTPVELFPVLASADLRQTHTIIYPDNNWQRFANLLATTKGVIDGTGLRLRHMVAYDHGRIYDPKGFEYGYSRIACEAHGFHSQCAWRLDPLGVHE